MLGRIIEVEEVGFPKSIVLREESPVSELIDTVSLVSELLNRALTVEIQVELRDEYIQDLEEEITRGNNEKIQAE